MHPYLSIPTLPRGHYSPFFARQKKRIFLFFLWDDPVQNRPQNPAPAGCLFSTRKSRSEVPERGILGKKIAWGRVGRTGQKKEKRMHKKRWDYSLKQRVAQHLVQEFGPETPRLQNSSPRSRPADSGFGAANVKKNTMEIRP